MFYVSNDLMLTKLFPILFLFLHVVVSIGQTPAIEPGVSHELAIWRAAHYSDVRYKLNLTLEKMSPVLKGTIEIRVKVSEPLAAWNGDSAQNRRRCGGSSRPTPIILDWRKIAGHEKDSTISNVSINGKPVELQPAHRKCPRRDSAFRRIQ